MTPDEWGYVICGTCNGYVPCRDASENVMGAVTCRLCLQRERQ